MVCGNTKSGKIVIGSLVLLTGAVLVILYLLFALFGGNAGVSDSGTRLHLSHYSGSSNEFRFGPSRISGIQPNIEKFLKPYDLTNKNVYNNCDPAFKLLPADNQTCGVDIRKFASCSTNNFGLNVGHPCIFVKFDTEPGWTPEYFNISELPDDMPRNLQSQIESNVKRNSRDLETLWISCEGLTDEDKRAAGTINILPRSGFQGMYFDALSCKSAQLCMDPLVAIQFQNIETKNVEISIRCQVWAKNANDTVEFKLIYVD